MVRETRHLWVGNLPENIREERIREHFKRYGRVQSVKLLPRGSKEATLAGCGSIAGGGASSASAEGTLACTIAFMDIKSAAKAHTAEHKLEERTLTTEYYEPAAIPSAAAPQTPERPAAAAAGPYTTATPNARFPNSHGSSEEHTGFSERFYERGSGRVADPEYLRRPGYHDTSRGRARDRLYRNGPTYPSAIIDRSHRSTLGSSWPYEGTSARYSTGQAPDAAYVSTTPVVEPAERRSSADVQVVKKKTKSRSGSRTPSPSGSTSSRSPSRSRSRSSSSSSSSSTSRGSSSPTSSPRTRGSRVQSAVSAAPPVHSEDRRPLAIIVRNLPARSSDTSLKDGLFHEYKKHGKVTWVKVVGQSSDRYALVCFKKPDDVDKALEVSYDKSFFGCKIEVGPYQGYDVEDNEFRPYEAELDEYHPKATRTLFIGNLEKDVTASDLRKHFDTFGEIIEIDIKKQGAVSSYAFCQYSDIVSVVKAIRKMDGEHLGNNRIKLGFGKSMPTPCVWVDGVSERVDEKYLTLQFERYGQVTQVSIDRDRGHALIFFEQLSCAQTAVKEMRGVTLRGKKLQVDFASRECQDTFFDHLEKQGAGSERPAFDTARDPVQRERSFETSTLAPANRYTSTRYDTPSRPRTSSYSSRSGTGSQCTGSSAVPSPGTPGSVTPRGSGSRSRLTRFNEYYEAGVEYPERRFRSYDEFSQGSGASHEDVYEHEYIYNRESPGHVEPVESRTMQSVVVTTEIPPTVTTFVPPDIRHLQKERVHLLEQLDECPSSGDELMSPKKRLKLDICDVGTVVTDVVVDVSHGDHRKVIEVRRLSDTTIKHHSRRPSIDGKHCVREVPVERTYMPHAVCKRRKTSGSESDRPRIHHHHDMSGSESLAGSRPGTPLCDERPENLPPSEPRRLPRERNANEGPLSLPLPRFAAQVLNSPRLNISVAGFKGSKENIVSSPPAAVTSPKVANPIPPSPVHVPPPASPPPRPPSSSNSSDSDAAPPSPSLEERLRSLDEKYEKWSGSRALSAAGGDALAKLDASASERFRFRHKLLDLDLKELQPSEIVKSVLAKRSVFDEDSKRLENVGEKYEPRDFTALPRTFVSLQTNVVGVAGGMNTPPAVPASPLLSPATSSAKSLSGTALSPRSLASSIPAAKGLQYPFPSHPPVVSPVAGGTASAPSPARVTGNVHSDNTRLKLCPSLPSDRTNSKVNLNRSGCAAAPPSSVVSGAAVASTVSKHKSLDKNGDSDKINSNIPINSCENASVNVSSSATTVTCSAANSSSDAVTNHVGKTPPRDKSTSRKEDRSSDKVSKGDKVVGRRDSVSSSPSSANSSKCDRKDRREKKSEKDNDTNGDYRTGKAKDNDTECDRKREKESEYCDRKLEEEKQRTERERAEKERLETERKEKEERERLEKERQEHERQEKERLEKEKLEKERQEKERQEKEKQEWLEKERLERERKKEKEERERQERERREREERERREREERERREREERERREKEERERREKEEREKREKEEQIERERIEKEKQRERERREREEKERREREELEKERQEKELHEKQMKEKQEHRKREKEIEKHERRHKEDNHESKEKKKDKEDYDKDKQKQRENHSDNSIDIKNRHRENHIDTVKVNDRHRDNHDSRKENNKDHDFRIKDTHENMRNNHEMQRKDSHDKSKDHHDSSRSNSDRRDEKHSHCNDVRKDESSKNRHHIEREDSKDKRKDSIKEIRDINNHEKNRHFSTDSRDNNKDRHSSTDSRHTSTDSEKNRQYNDHALNSTPNRIDVSKRKDKVNSAPASVGCKRRISSQDSSESPDDSKRIKVNAEHRKISDRRDSKDSRDSNASRSSDKIKQNKHNKSNFTRMLEDKIREEKRNKELSDEKRREKEREREREDRYKLKQQKIEKQKIKSKNRESRDSKDCPGTPKSTTKELLLDKDFLARLDLRANDEEEKQKLQRKDSKEKRKLENHEIDERRSSDDTKRPDERKKDKILSGEKKRDENMIKNSEDKNKNPQQRKEPQRIRKQTNSSDTSDSDEPKKHSIFDIVDDEPAYISMYDKVKARSCKNMQKQEEEKRQEKLKAKFTQLKQSRAKREEKKRSTSWDEDSDSDHMDSGNQDHQDQDHITNKQNRRGNKMLITSSSEDELHSMNKSRKKPDMYTDSDSDRVRPEKLERLNDSSDEEAARNKSVSRKGSKSRITSDTSEDEQPRKRVEKIKKERYSDSEVDQGFADSDERTDMKHYKKPKEEKLNHYDEDKYIKKEKKSNTKISSLSDDETTRKMLTDAVKAEIYAEKEEIKIENRLAMLCDISSEGENVHNMEIKKDLFGEEKSENRKKHKKQKKRQKNSLLSEDTIKLERMLDEVENDSGNRGDESLSLEKKMSEKKKHGSKKDKKRDKVKDEDRIKEKSKKLKKLNKELCSKGDLQHVIKRDGKLEDIFGSFSDDSETGNKDSLMNNIGNKENSFFVHLPDKLQSSHMYASDSDSIIQQIDPEKEKLKEESRKRKEKKRKEKERRMREENENSVDFADLGKVLEDNLKDEPMSDEVEKSAKPIKTEPEEEHKVEENHNSSDIFRFSDDDDSPEIEKKELVEKKELKEKKKKRKKSKEEKQNRHHHHHEKNQDKVEKIKSPDLIKKELPALIIENIKEEQDIKPSQQSPSLPNLLDIPSPPQAKSTSNIDFQISPLPREPLISPIPKTPTSSKVEKKREKFIPGFGSEIDEKIHENAVKSISDFGSPTLNERIEQEEIIKAEDVPKVEKTEVIEDKPRVIISQEETEDAVAALLGESFGGGDFNCYNESQPSPTTAETTVETTNDEVTLAEDDEEMRQAVQSLNVADMEAKPDTPQSEHDLQIDTDTDDGEEVVVPYEQSPRTPDMVDLSRPPKTPDFPTGYYRPPQEDKIQTPILIKTSTNNTISQIKSPAPKEEKSISDPINEVKRNIEVQIDKPVIQAPVPRKIEQSSPEPSRTVISQSWTLPNVQLKPPEKIVVTEPVKVEPVVEKRKPEQQQIVTQHKEESKPAPHKPAVAQKSLPSLPTSLSLPPLQASTQSIVTTPTTTVLTSQSKYLAPPVIKISDHTSHSNIISPKIEQSLSPVKNYNNINIISTISTTMPPALTTVMSKQRTMPQIPATKPVRIHPPVISHLTVASSKPQNPPLISQSGGLLTTVVTSTNAQTNRLPIQSIIASKPILPTTMILPQSKIAVSTIQKIVSSPEVSKSQEPPRMIYHSSGNMTVPSYSYPHTLCHPQPMPTSIPVPLRTAVPSVGLLAPARHILPPTSYSLPPTTRSLSPLVKEQAKSVIEKTMPVISELQKPAPISMPAHIYSQPSFSQSQTSLHMVNTNLKATPVIKEAQTPKLVPLTTPEVRISQPSIIQQAPPQKPTVQEIIRHSPISQSVVSQVPHSQPPMIVVSKPVTTVSHSTVCHPVISHVVMSQPVILQPTASQPVTSHTVIPQSVVSQQSQPITSHKVMPQSIVSQHSLPITSHKVMPQSIVSQQSQPVTAHKVMSQPIVSQQSQPVISHKVMPQSIVSQSQSVTSHKVMPQSIVSQQSHKVMPQSIVSLQSQPVSSHKVMPQSIVPQQSQPVTSHKVIPQSIVSQQSQPVTSHKVMPPTIVSQQPQPATAHKVMSQSVVSQHSQPVTSHKVMPQIIVSQQSQPHILVSQHSQAMIPKSIVSQPIISQSVSTTAIVSHSSIPKPVISHSAASTLSVNTDIATVKSPLENRTPTSAPQDIINEIPKVIKETISRSTPSPVIVSTPKEHLSPVPPPVQESQIKKEESVEKDNPSPNINKHIPEDNLLVKKEIKSEDNKLAIIEETKVEIKPKIEVTETDEKKLEIKQHPEPIEGISVIKEVDHYEKEKQEDTESVISEPKESLTSELCLKDDPLDSKEDSDYWSAKEVNIESVIKKVDALCSADELSEGSEAGKDEWYENETKVAQPETKQHESIGKEPEKSEDCNNSDVTKTDAESENLDESVDNNSEEKELSVRNSRRGGRLRGRKNNKSDRTGVTTRRGKSATTTTSRRGGRGGRTRNDKKTKQSESDVYEFHDDSDESKDRPRLILTIKSPAGAGNTPSTPSAVIKETVQKPPEPPLEFVSPAANTRKSRRIQERDGSRNTVDDIIEDVVRNVAVVTRSAAAAAQGLPSPRRSTRQNVLKQPPVVEPRKSPRATRRKDRRVSENTDDSSEEKSTKKEELKSEPEPVKEEVVVKEVIKVPPKQQEKEKTKIEITPPLGLKANLIRRLKSEEPMTLIDPVTGLLTQMRECEEGKYIPVSNAASSVITGTVTTRPSIESKSEVPDTCRLSTSTVTSVHHPIEQVPTTVIAKSQPAIPVLQKPQSLKAHVLSSQAAKVVVNQAAKVVVNQAAKVVVNQAAKVVVNQPAPIPKTATVQTVPQPQQQQQQQPNFIAKPNIPVSQHLNVNVSLASTMDPTNLSPRQTAPKPIHVLPQTMKNVTPSPMSPNQIGTISNPKQHFLQAAKQQIPPKPSTPINPKTHLLNAVQNQNIVSGSPSVVNATLTHIKSTHMPQSSSLPSPVKQQVVVANVAPIVKPHNLHVPQQILTGAVASPPLKHHIAQQPIVTGASSGRMGIPSSSPMPGISAKGAMDPQKVEVSMAGCVMISHPTVSPQAQARGQVLQAGMPVPAYEASLHGVGDHPLFSRQSPPPAHQQTSPAPQGEPLSHFPPGAMPLRTPHDLPPHHFMHSHPVYQQYLRAQQEARIPYHLPRSPMVGGLEKTKDGQEGEEAPVTSPPLELRRPGSVGLTPRPTAVPHSLQSPHDRATDSPQVAQVYVHQPRIPHYHTPGRYYEPTEPPPAHRPVTSHTALTGPGSSLGAAGNLTGAMARHTGAEAPTTQRGLQVATPPHASQVPPQADSLLMLLKQYRIMWQGLLALKNDQAAVQMHFVFGNPHVARNSLPCNSDGSTPPLRIAQRMRLEKTQVEGVARKMQMENEHCVLLALPCGRDHMDVLQQSTNLSHGFITYLQQKEAAGIVNIAAPGSQHAAYVVHIFPSCDFVKENLARIAPNLLHRVADIAHLLIVIATV